MKFQAVRKAAMALPETTEEPHHDFGSFRVKGKIFVTVPPGEEHIHVFVPEEQREVALALHSSFIEKLLWGGKLVGLRVALASAIPTVVTSLVLQAYQFKSAKSAARPRAKSANQLSGVRNAA
jgi:hypothetical protein